MGSETMNLYFVNADADDQDMSLDWFVIAEDALEAERLWQQLEEVQDFTPSRYTIRLIGEAPAKFGQSPRTLCWHNDLTKEIVREPAS